MAEITAQMVKELRERTGAGVKECKDILEQTNGDIEKAIEELRKRGLRVSDKVAGREAKEGRIEVYIHHGARVAAMVDTNCDPDLIDYVIPCNDDAIRSIRLIAAKIADAAIEGQNRRESLQADVAHGAGYEQEMTERMIVEEAEAVE